MLLITIPDQYPNYYKALEIYTGYFDSLDNMILFSYPSSILVTRDYCSSGNLLFACPDKTLFFFPDENQIADDLAKNIRVLCWVMTAPANHKNKAKHVKATWGKRCTKLIFMSTRKDPALGAVGLKVKEGRDYLWGKTRAAFKYIHKNHIDDYDWFLKADDDTYVIMENLRKLLKDYKATDPIHFGRRFRPYAPNGYMSGGAGYVLSREAVTRFVKEALPNPYKCRMDAEGAEDLEMGLCLDHVGVYAGDSRDSMGREKFHPFIPEHHLIPGLIPHDNWYWSYNWYPQKSVCMTGTSIYVSPRRLYCGSVLSLRQFCRNTFMITIKIMPPRAC